MRYCNSTFIFTFHITLPFIFTLIDRSRSRSLVAVVVVVVVVVGVVVVVVVGVVVVVVVGVVVARCRRRRRRDGRAGSSVRPSVRPVVVDVTYACRVVSCRVVIAFVSCRVVSWCHDTRVVVAFVQRPLSLARRARARSLAW